MEFTIGTLQACDSIPCMYPLSLSCLTSPIAGSFSLTDNTIPEIPDEDEPSHAQTKRNTVSMDSTGEMNDLSRLIGHLHYDGEHARHLDRAVTSVILTIALPP